MQWFPALHALAKERNWRLVGFSKSACPPAEVTINNASLRREYRECDEWRERTLKRMAQEENPSMVVTSSLTTYRVREDGKRLNRDASTEALAEGYASTLRKLRSTGASVALIEDVPHPHRDIPECVSRSLRNLEECTIPKSKAFNYPPANA